MFIKKVFSDVLYVYKSPKNILHWYLSKVIILIFSLVLGILLAIVPISVLLIWMYLDSINWIDILSDIANYWILDWLIPYRSILLANKILVILYAFLFIITPALFLFGLSYQLILFNNLSINAINKKNLPYSKNHYLKFSIIFKYMKILLWMTLMYFVLLISFLITLYIYAAIVWWTLELRDIVDDPAFSIKKMISMWILFFYIVLAIYLSFRISFAIISITDEDITLEKNTAFSHLKNSFQMTRWLDRLLKFIIIMSLAILLFGMLNFMFNISLWLMSLLYFKIWIIWGVLIYIIRLIYYIITLDYLFWFLNLVFASIYKNILFEQPKKIIN